MIFGKQVGHLSLLLAILGPMEQPITGCYYTEPSYATTPYDFEQGAPPLSKNLVGPLNDNDSTPAHHATVPHSEDAAASVPPAQVDHPFDNQLFETQLEQQEQLRIEQWQKEHQPRTDAEPTFDDQLFEMQLEQQERLRNEQWQKEHALEPTVNAEALVPSDKASPDPVQKRETSQITLPGISGTANNPNDPIDWLMVQFKPIIRGVRTVGATLANALQLPTKSRAQHLVARLNEDLPAAKERFNQLFENVLAALTPTQEESPKKTEDAPCDISPSTNIHEAHNPTSGTPTTINPLDTKAIDTQPGAMNNYGGVPPTTPAHLFSLWSAVQTAMVLSLATFAIQKGVATDTVKRVTACVSKRDLIVIFSAAAALTGAACCMYPDILETLSTPLFNEITALKSGATPHWYALLGGAYLCSIGALNGIDRLVYEEEQDS